MKLAETPIRDLYRYSKKFTVYFDAPTGLGFMNAGKLTGFEAGNALLERGNLKGEGQHLHQAR